MCRLRILLYDICFPTSNVLNNLRSWYCLCAKPTTRHHLLLIQHLIYYTCVLMRCSKSAQLVQLKLNMRRNQASEVEKTKSD
jgi:hypothetical protein